MDNSPIKEIRTVEASLPKGLARLTCRHCNHPAVLDADRSRLYWAGLLPVRCGDCDRMLATARFSALLDYVRGRP